MLQVHLSLRCPIQGEGMALTTEGGGPVWHKLQPLEDVPLLSA
jgi:hypothetical protein